MAKYGKQTTGGRKGIAGRHQGARANRAPNLGSGKRQQAVDQPHKATPLVRATGYVQPGRKA